VAIGILKEQKIIGVDLEGGLRSENGYIDLIQISY